MLPVAPNTAYAMAPGTLTQGIIPWVNNYYIQNEILNGDKSADRQVLYGFSSHYSSWHKRSSGWEETSGDINVTGMQFYGYFGPYD